MFFLIVKPQPLRSNPFPYTTLFRSRSAMMTFGHQLIEGDAGINPNSFDGLRVRAAERNMEFPMAAGDVGELTLDRKSTRLNSSHVRSSYAVFCLIKKNSKIPEL